jgi:hypothetical protein
MQGCSVNTAGLVASVMTDAELIDAIERIRARNNTHWMNLIRLAFEVATDRARAILQEIQRLDSEVARLTRELAG